MIEEERFETVEDCFKAAAERIAHQLRSALRECEKARLGVCGGKTARNVLPLLACEPLDWGKVTISLVDERFVSHDKEERNDLLVKQCFHDVGNYQPHLLSLVNDSGEGVLEKGAQNPLDTVFLGMGEDGHIASLFPGGVDSWEAKGPIVATTSPLGISKRVSLTPRSILVSKEIVLVIAGSKKNDIYQRAKTQGLVEEFPVRILFQQNLVPVKVFLA